MLIFIADNFVVEANRQVAIEMLQPINWEDDNATRVADALTELSAAIFQQNIRAGWWNDLKTGASIIDTRNRSELLMLVVSELAEAMEGFRKNLMDEHLPTRRSAEVELADAIIRILDTSAACGFNIGAAIMAKLSYNQKRKDHTMEARQQNDGKKF